MPASSEQNPEIQLVVSANAADQATESAGLPSTVPSATDPSPIIPQSAPMSDSAKIVLTGLLTDILHDVLVQGWNYAIPLLAEGVRLMSYSQFAAVAEDNTASSSDFTEADHEAYLESFLAILMHMRRERASLADIAGKYNLDIRRLAEFAVDRFIESIGRRGALEANEVMQFVASASLEEHLQATIRNPLIADSRPRPL